MAPEPAGCVPHPHGPVRRRELPPWTRNGNSPARLRVLAEGVPGGGRQAAAVAARDAPLPAGAGEPVRRSCRRSGGQSPAATIRSVEVRPLAHVWSCFGSGAPAVTDARGGGSGSARLALHGGGAAGIERRILQQSRAAALLCRPDGRPHRRLAYEAGPVLRAKCTEHRTFRPGEDEIFLAVLLKRGRQSIRVLDVGDLSGTRGARVGI